MTYYSVAEQLAAEAESSAYVPTGLHSCESELTADRNPVAVHLTEFMLFNEKRPSPGGPRYLALQPQYLLGKRTASRRETAYRTAVKIPRSEDLTDRLESAGVDVTRYDAGWGAYWIRLREADLTNSRDLLIEMIRRASDAPAEEDADLAVRAASSPGSEQ
jgi:hypothetical protein